MLVSKCLYNPVEPVADFKEQALKDDASKGKKTKVDQKLHKSWVLLFHIMTKMCTLYLNYSFFAPCWERHACEKPS